MAESQGNLRNDDFRKLLTSTRSSRPAESTFTAPEKPASGGASFRHKQPKPKNFKKPAHTNSKAKKEKDDEEDDETKLNDILKNYRDRAAERRKQGEKTEDTSKLTASYRAVPGDARTARDQADMRKQAILESKYLGGDIEHTHLVKGLDYSLLNKVRSEITKSVEEEDDDIEAAYDEGGKKADVSLVAELAQSHSENRMVRTMHRVLFKNEVPLKNELFAKGRMAYVVELDDEASEIPTTLLRSIHECPRTESAQSIQANNLIISKLTQVLSYLRADKQKKRKDGEISRNEEKGRDSEKHRPKGDSIYDDIDDYAPSRRQRSRSRERDDRRDRERDRRDREKERDRNRDRDNHRDNREKDRERRDYFESSSRDREREKEKARRDEREQKNNRDKERREKDKVDKDEKEKKRLDEKLEKRRKETESAGYDECYPGGMVEMEGGWDSDEEADFSKMDMGTKKGGGLNRWDFDTEEEYASYMEGREALPKAAYQYGVKASEGRKTRKATAANETKKLDRELTEINKIMEKRKAANDGQGDYKKPKY